MKWKGKIMDFGSPWYDTSPKEPTHKFPINVIEEHVDGTCKGIIVEDKLSASERLLLDYVY